MDIGKSFSFQFEDRQWISKLGLGAVIAIIPILNFAWSGYIVGIMRNVANNLPEPLPQWDDLGKKFTEGLILFAVGLVYALPILIVLCLPLSIFIFSSILSGNNNLQNAAQTLAAAGGVLFACLMCLFIIYLFVLSVVYPAILVLYSREGTFASCFKFREIFNLINRNAAPFLTAWGINLLSGIGIGLGAGIFNALIGWIPCVGWIAALIVGLGASVYIATIYAHLFGQFGAIAFGSKQEASAV
jgi:hypothetical protein